MNNTFSVEQLSRTGIRDLNLKLDLGSLNQATKKWNKKK